MLSASPVGDNRGSRGTISRIVGRLESRVFALPPQPLTSFVGRERELDDLSDLLRSDVVRLLNITGPGGVGKTRVAMRLAENLAPEFPDGVAFVSLAAITDPALVAGAIIQALGEREVSGSSQFDRLCLLLRQRHLLLVLDNFEQVVTAAPTVVRLLAACAGVKALVTSRVRLHVSGEQEYALPPLGVPVATTTSIDDLEASPSVTLFVQRARSVRPTFALERENADAVAAVCRRLDGLPLAIELAAARSKVLSPTALQVRLEHGLDLLSGGPRDQPERLQTLRAAIAWSYDLLSAEERRVFCRLAVFAGGFTLNAADAVAAGETKGENGRAAEDHLPPFTSVLDSVAALVDSSLLQEVEGFRGDARFGMLQTIREFGLETLAASGEEDSVRAAHAAWYLALTEQAEPDMGPTQPMWLSLLESEHPNLRLALDWYIAQGDAVSALRQAGALWPFWFFHNHFEEGVSWLARALALPAGADDPAGVRDVALLGAGILASVLGDFDRSSAWHEEGLALARTGGDPTNQGRALFGLGGVARHRGEDTVAISWLGDALALFRSTGDLSWMASTLNSLGNVAHRMGDLDGAAAYGEEALAISRRLGEEWSTAEALGIVAVVAYDRGELERAAELWAQSLEVYSELRDRRAIARTVAGLAVVAVAHGHYVQGAQLFGASERMQDAIGASQIAMRRSWYQPRLVEARTWLGASEFASAWAAGQALTLEDVITEARSVAEGLQAAGIGHARSGASSGRYGLSPREVEVLRLLVAGQTDREIGETLFISRRTAQGHVARVFDKMGVNTRTAAVTAAISSGILADPSSPQ